VELDFLSVLSAHPLHTFFWVVGGAGGFLPSTNHQADASVGGGGGSGLALHLGRNFPVVECGVEGGRNFTLLSGTNEV